jgi:hypothetical protein
VKTLRDAGIVLAGVAGLVLWLGACSLAPTGAKGAKGATFSGTISNSQGGTAIANATVTVTPTGGTALPGVQTSSSGTYTVDAVPAGDGSVAVSSLPSTCQAPTPVTYTGAKNGGSRTLNIVVACDSTIQLP